MGFDARNRNTNNPSPAAPAAARDLPKGVDGDNEHDVQRGMFERYLATCDELGQAEDLERWGCAASWCRALIRQNCFREGAGEPRTPEHASRSYHPTPGHMPAPRDGVFARGLARVQEYLAAGKANTM